MLLFEDFQLLDAAGPIAVFEIASRFAPIGYRLRLASTTGGLVRSSSGVAWPTEALKGLRAPGLDTLIIVGGEGTRAAARDPALVATMQKFSKRARRTASVCSGAFVLAAAGLLKHKRAATHWRRAALLQRLYPDAKVEPDSIWTKDGAIWTSAGISAGIDLALAMIREDLGPDIAKSTAREMVVYAQRPGGQSQHSALLDLAPPDSRFAELSAWMRTHLKQDLSVDALAARASMSPRNFARRFTKETGSSPAKAVERLRLEAARDAIEAGQSVSQALAQSGFGDSERMRRAFLRHFGAPPAAMKRTLRHA
jgi:transcriptional regulator GlxA family with amidase domain